MISDRFFGVRNIGAFYLWLCENVHLKYKLADSGAFITKGYWTVDFSDVGWWIYLGELLGWQMHVHICRLRPKLRRANHVFQVL